jgi:hypothetical protein
MKDMMQEVLIKTIKDQGMGTVGNQKTTLTMHAAPTTFFLTLALQTPTT